MASWDSTSGAGTLSLHVIETSQNIPSNYTTVYYELRLYCYNGISWSSTPVFWEVNINGNVANGNYTFDFRGSSMKLIASGYFDIPHNPDGTKSILSTGHSNNTGVSAIGGPIGVSGVMALTSIPRATVPTVSPSSGNTGSAFTIGHTPASSTFVHDVAYSLNGGASYTNIATNVAGTTTSTSWTPAHTLLPNTGSVTAIIRLTTKASSGGSTIGTQTVNLPLSVPSTVIPTVSSVTWADAQTSAPDLPTLMGGSGRFVQRWSKLVPTVTSVGAGGSTIVSSAVTQNGQETASGTAFGLPIALSGAVPFTVVATDSRGRTNAPYASTVTVTAYNFPNLPTPGVTRTSDAAGNIPSPTGTYLRINPGASVSSLVFGGSQKNLLEWQVRIKPNGGSYTTVQAWTSATVSGNTWTTKYIPAGSYAANTEWVVEVSIRDVFGKGGYSTGSTVVSREILVPTENIFLDWDQGVGIGIGGYRRPAFKLDIHGDIGQNGNPVLDESDMAGQIAAAIAAAVLADSPIGSYKAHSGPTLNASYALCDGAAISRTGNSVLYALIGTSWGVGDGTTTFNVPDFRGRVPIGAVPLRAMGTATFNSSTDVVTLTAHGTAEGRKISFTGGTMPTGITSGVEYFVRNVSSTNTFQLSTTATGAILDFTTNGSGTITANDPNFVLNRIGGTDRVALGNNEMPPHSHGITTRDYDYGFDPSAGGDSPALGSSNTTQRVNSTSTISAGAGQAHENLPPYGTVNWFIRIAA